MEGHRIPCISAIADEIWQYRTGGNLTILTKITTLQKQSSCSQAYGFATITMYTCHEIRVEQFIDEMG